MTSLFKCQEDIPAHGYGNMGNHSIIISQLCFPFLVQVVFHHLEKHADVPPLTVDANNFLVYYLQFMV